MKILVTGGAGYIGSHTCIELLSNGHDVLVFDNLSNGHFEALRRVQEITNRKLDFLEGDIRDQFAVENAISSNGCEAVIHFAGLKSVSESVNNPLAYYDSNVVGTHRLLLAMQKCQINKFVFSSSATVYGIPQFLPITEKHALSATNAYGRTKLIIEDMLRDVYKSDPDWSILLLRYFNPVGAHPSGQIGECPHGTPNNLMPFIAQVASGEREYLNIWGIDYPTQDGTGVRDYIHVVDLANAHISALARLHEPQCTAFNIGTGAGYSVLDVVKAFETASASNIPYRISDRREGDVATCFGDPRFAESTLNWKATRNLDEMCSDHWRWKVNNPNGFF
jgi:UDP-glucose 4-epimerase